MLLQCQCRFRKPLRVRSQPLVPPLQSLLLSLTMAPTRRLEVAGRNQVCNSDQFGEFAFCFVLLTCVLPLRQSYPQARLFQRPSSMVSVVLCDLKELHAHIGIRTDRRSRGPRNQYSYGACPRAWHIWRCRWVPPYFDHYRDAAGTSGTDTERQFTPRQCSLFHVDVRQRRLFVYDRTCSGGSGRNSFCYGL